jgi:hypothetical protein
MIKFKIITDLTENQETSNVYFTDSLGGIHGIPPHDISMEFDEDHMMNKTIEVSTQASNLCYLVANISGIHISHMFRAECVAWLAKSIAESMPSEETPSILFANYLTDGVTSLITTDKFAAPTPLIKSPMGPIKNNKILIEDLILLYELIRKIDHGKYPSVGYTYVDHNGGLQPWYPYGGIKGHKKKLLEEGVPFIDVYKADVGFMQKSGMWRLKY